MNTTNEKTWDCCSHCDGHCGPYTNAHTVPHRCQTRATVVPLTSEEDAELRITLNETEYPQPEQTGADPFAAKVQGLFDQAAELLLSKHADYGPLNIALSPGGPINGLRVRLYDKLARLNNLVDTGAEPQHESLEDTWRDIIGYGAIGLLVTRGDWPDA